jgi:DNA-binding NarL/FixJ family response regulator
VAVWDPLPLYQEALTRALEGADLEVDAPRDIVAYTRQQSPAVVVVTLSESDPQLLVDLRQASPNTEIVVLLADTSLASYQSVMDAGATAPVRRAAPASEVVGAVQAALGHRTVLPAEVAHALVQEKRSARPGYEVSREEIEWLRALGQGLTVAETAERFGLSERVMYRRLRVVYDTMGVSGRVEAIAAAVHLGWF